MGRTILAIIAGVILGSIAVFGIEMISTSLYPPAADLDLSNMEDMKKHVASIPTTGYLLVILAHLIGAGVAGFVASRISNANRKTKYKHGLIAAGVMLLATIVNIIQIPHPVWVSILDVLLVIAFGLMGSRFGADKDL